MENLNGIGNIQYSENQTTLSLNPKLYPIDVVYTVAYIMIDKAFIMLDGDPEEEIIVEIRKKSEEHGMKDIVEEFNEQLLNHLVYKNQSTQNQVIRETLLQRALMTNAPQDPSGADKKENGESHGPDKDTTEQKDVS
ncbi:hypothetical protein ACFL96_16540 [Thermoproteota archaeon]